MTKFVVRTVTGIIAVGGLTLIYLLREMYQHSKKSPVLQSTCNCPCMCWNISKVQPTEPTTDININHRTQTQIMTKTYYKERNGFLHLTEKEISTDNNINDNRTWVNGSLSTIEFSPKRSSYSLGEEIRVVITLYDGYGKRRTKGGEYLRLWMWNNKLGASVSGKVFDYNNGTFIGILKAVWSGSATIGVFIARRREEIASYYETFKYHQSIRGIRSEFVNGMSKEEVVCSIVPQVKKARGREWCNLTMKNDGFPWFCWKPRKPDLTCDMWRTSWSTHFAFNGEVLKKFDERRWTGIRGLPLVIKGTKPIITPPSAECNKITPEQTWKRISPNGFFYKDKWQSTQCTDTLPRSVEAYSKCLKGRTLYLHGDSTSRQFSEILLLMFKVSPPQGHNPYFQHFPKHNFSISWHAHELPFYHGGIHYNKSATQAQHVLLDRLPNNSKDIIVLYLYVHFTLNHPDVFRQHVGRLVQSAKLFLARAPNAIVAVRGPHAYYHMKVLLSYWGLEYMDILHKEFASLRTRVVYLDYWDLTVAKLSHGQHPATKTVHSMVHNMMAMLCFRDTR